mgnify:CR=1 FL=1
MLTVAPALLAAGCGDDGDADGDGTTSVASGFAEQDGGPATSNADGPTTAADDDTGTPFVGDMRGLATFVYSAETSNGLPARVGLAGGYRLEDPGFAGIDDLYSPISYQLAFPPLPAVDTVLFEGPVPVFDWGDEDQWLQAGNGMKLRQGEGGPEVLACLAQYFPTMEVPSGYPMYVTNATQAAECSAVADAFVPAAAYDVILYGGELFVDNVLPERVTTPPALEVTAPDFATYDAPLSSGSDLAFAWNASDDATTRIQIRLIDADGNLLSAHAADDGSFTIPASELGALSPGPLDILIARERDDDVQFTNGGLTVTSRWERWGFFQLD